MGNGNQGTDSKDGKHGDDWVGCPLGPWHSWHPHFIPPYVGEHEQTDNTFCPSGGREMANEDERVASVRESRTPIYRQSEQT